ncbi:hypothetical protein EVA_21033 [gut metagenome]|uniref:Ferrichrome ABC transporter substrate-binding protein n=1 Tax=gut metagenome TaxID=749906 RepID=J9F8V5_9ZZZZ
MDLKLFLIMAVILIGIFKEVKKVSKSSQTGNSSPDFPNPLPDATEESPMPEAWNLPKPFEQVPMPTPKRTTPKAFPADTETEYPVFQRRKNKKNRAQHAMSQKDNPQTVHQPLAPPTEIPATTKTETETAGYEEDFQIRSAEEARKAIIWGEILQRKY